MAADRSYIAENDRERRRLEALVGKRDDAALSRPMPDGWTVASVLAHLAFWDQRIATFIEKLHAGELTAAELLARYCALLYRRLGTYAEVAKRTGLDPRTSRKYVTVGLDFRKHRP